MDGVAWAERVTIVPGPVRETEPVEAGQSGIGPDMRPESAAGPAKEPGVPGAGPVRAPDGLGAGPEAEPGRAGNSSDSSEISVIVRKGADTGVAGVTG